MKLLNTQVVFFVAVIFLSIPWMLLGAPLFNNNIINGTIFGVISYLISYRIGRAVPSQKLALLFILLSSGICILAIAIYGYPVMIDKSYLKFSALIGFFLGWGVVELLHRRILFGNKNS